MGRIFYVMGKSSSGKDTIFRRLLHDESLGLKRLVGYTTRPMRENEADGREYIFVSEKKLNELTEEGKVIECRNYNTVYGKWYYFTADDHQIDLDRNDYLLIGTLESYEKVAAYYGVDEQEQQKVVPVYIDVEDGERLMRAVRREREQPVPGYREVCRRFLADSEDFSEERLQRAGIVRRFENDDLMRCCQEIREMILSLQNKNMTSK